MSQIKNYTFDGKIEKKVLENYLSRAVTGAGLLYSDTLDDDLRVIKRLGIKFVGRATGVWKPMPDDEEHFECSKELAEKVHEVDPEIILQACIFEAIYKKIEDFKIPAYVFEEMGRPVENRCFRFEDTIFPEKPQGFISEGKNGIPDISRDETRLWFYYRATKYIDAGYEALHMGQIHLYTANDGDFVKTSALFEKIREYGKKHARRHKVLMDAHTHGIQINGKLLFDYHAMPYTRAPLLKVEGEKLVLVREGFSEGGISPDGWSADVMPYLMEYDNWGGKVVEDFSKYTLEERAYMDWWGYDQIAWFASQDEESRNAFLEYTYKWTAVNNVNAYFAFPLRRTLYQAEKQMVRGDNGELDTQCYYQMNDISIACPMGFNQEKIVEKLWDVGDLWRETMGNPEDLLDFGAKGVVDEETGIKIPEKVVIYGSFQPYVGAVENDSNSEITRMYYRGKNTYTLTVVLPYPGTYDFAVSTYGTLSSTYCNDRFPRSGSSNKGYFTVDKRNTLVSFSYVFLENTVRVSKKE